MKTETFHFVDAGGQHQDVEIDISIYKAAASNNLSVPQYLQHKYPSDTRFGSTFSQMLQSAGMFLKADHKLGIQPPTMKMILDDGAGADILASPLVRNDGSERLTVSGRYLFPAVILELVASSLSADESGFLNAYDRMVAIKTNVTSPRVDQPKFDFTAPEDSASAPIAQLAEPKTMVSITLSEQSFNIPVVSNGLMISDQAAEAATLDLVGIIMTAQAKGEYSRMIKGQLSSMMNGDVDWGETALSSITAQSLDSSIAAAGEMTQKAWVHYLWDDNETMTYDWLLMTIDTALAIEKRADKPTVSTDDPTSRRIDSLFTVENLSIPTPKILLVSDTVVGANTVVGLNSGMAIRQVVNVNASYQAIEQWVMRRATAFRIDYGQLSKKLYTQAWKKMTLTV